MRSGGSPFGRTKIRGTLTKPENSHSRRTKAMGGRQLARLIRQLAGCAHSGFAPHVASYQLSAEASRCTSSRASPHKCRRGVTNIHEGMMLCSKRGTFAGGCDAPAIEGTCVVGRSKSHLTNMTGAEFRSRLRELGRTDAAFAEEVGSSTRSVSRWVSEGPPPEIAYLVDLLLTLELHIGAPISPEGGAGKDAFDIVFDDMLARAAISGRKSELIASMRRWLEHQYVKMSRSTTGES
ncbi:hypothetical protein ES708_00484 [subsurface metagenome]|jgi:hypothetical protein